jgi:anaerobic ribonucleoside-triphosphate reductase activating protein
MILRDAGDLEGVTISGGEPFEQPEGLHALLSAIRRGSGLSILVFSGFTVEEIAARPLGPETLALIDVLIDGRYVAGERLGRGLRGSANQRIQLLSQRYTLAEVEATPDGEVRIGPDGSLVISGVAPLRVR